MRGRDEVVAVLFGMGGEKFQGVLRKVEVIGFDVDGVKGNDPRECSRQRRSVVDSRALSTRNRRKRFGHSISSVAGWRGIRLCWLRAMIRFRKQWLAVLLVMVGGYGFARGDGWRRRAGRGVWW